MKNTKPILFSFIGLAVLLAILSLVLVLKMQTELSRKNATMEEALQSQLSATETELKSMKDRQAQLENMLESARKYTCRDVHVKSIAHRGLSAEAPENTLPAFLLAKERGFSCVETDIRFSADGVPVCIHDSNIDRTSNGTGAVSAQTLEELRQYDFGTWKGADFEGTDIPTFEDFISLCRNIGLHPYIELKTGSSEQIRQLVEIVKKYGMRRNVTWISFYAPLLSEVRWLDDEARLGFLINNFGAGVIDELRALRSGKNEVFLNSCVFHDQVVRECREAGFPLEVWTLDEKEQFLELDPYVTGVTSNVLSFGQYLYEMETARSPGDNS